MTSTLPEQHRLVAGGIMAAAGATGYGLSVFMAAGLAWLGLRGWHRRSSLGAA